MNVMSVQQQPNAIGCSLFVIAEHEKILAHLLICLQQDSSTLFPRASEKLARQEVLCTISMFIVLAGRYILKKISKCAKVISWHSVVPAMTGSTGSVC